MNWKFIFFWLTLLSAGCSNYRIKKELEQFVNSTVEIPSMEMVLNGKSVSPLFKHQTLNIKLLVYYTSPKGCLSCWISHLYNFERTFGTEINTAFTPIVIISLDDDSTYKDVFNQLISQPHLYPIYIDKTHLFEQVNINLPTDFRFHTFLLDKNNRVVLVGNPLSGGAMEKLFKSTLDNMVAHEGIYVLDK